MDDFEAWEAELDRRCATVPVSFWETVGAEFDALFDGEE